ncbi:MULTISPECIES: phosphopantetheine-binding protein [unclassified Amycolatopsis]|uniref:phosphopantetheine-binding protein n=1 Tax=unclassified Amycolatopsis TaxID=2618356 RepID=UPI0034568ABE
MSPDPARVPETFDELLAALTWAAGLEDEELLPDDNLFELGLDSVTLNRLVGSWRAAGVRASLVDFLERPTPEQWWEIVRESGVTTAS